MHEEINDKKKKLKAVLLIKQKWKWYLGMKFLASLRIVNLCFLQTHEN